MTTIKSNNCENEISIFKDFSSEPLAIANTSCILIDNNMNFYICNNVRDYDIGLTIINKNGDTRYIKNYNVNDITFDLDYNIYMCTNDNFYKINTTLTENNITKLILKDSSGQNFNINNPQSIAFNYKNNKLYFIDEWGILNEINNINSNPIVKPTNIEVANTWSSYVRVDNDGYIYISNGVNNIKKVDPTTYQVLISIDIPIKNNTYKLYCMLIDNNSNIYALICCDTGAIIKKYNSQLINIDNFNGENNNILHSSFNYTSIGSIGVDQYNNLYFPNYEQEKIYKISACTTTPTPTSTPIPATTSPSTTSPIKVSSTTSPSTTSPSTTSPSTTSSSTSSPIKVSSTTSPSTTSPSTSSPIKVSSTTSPTITPNSTTMPLISENYRFVTSLKIPANKGDTKIYVEDYSKFKIGDVIQIGTINITIAKVIGFGSLILDTPLKFDYNEKVPIGIITEEDNIKKPIDYTIYIIIAIIILISICCASIMIVKNFNKFVE
jgi:hypothetical protein